MNWIVLGARLLLAAVFMTAAMGKFIDLAGSRRTLAAFGVRLDLVPALAVLLPVAEATTALALMFSQTARIGGAAAVLLLMVFVYGIARAIIRGQAPDCNCFGQLSAKPAGWSTLVRNAVILVPAVIVVANPAHIHFGSAVSGSVLADVLAGTAMSLIFAFAALTVQLGLSRYQRGVEVKRLNTSLSVFPPGLPVGTQAPKFALPDLSGNEVSLDDLLSRGSPVAMVFVSSGCISCRMMFPDLARWQRVLPDRITIVPIGSGDPERLRALAEEFALQNVLVQREAEVFEMYRAAATPSLIIISPAGLVATRIRSSAAIVEAVIRRQLNAEPEPAPEPAPPEDSLQVLRWNG